MVVSAMVAGFLVAGPLPASAEPTPPARTQIHIDGLAADAVVVKPARAQASATAIPVRVRVQGSVTALAVRLNGKVLRPSGSRRDQFRLVRGSGLQLGRNQLWVEATVAGRTRPAVAERAFFLGYRASGVVRSKVRAGGTNAPAALAHVMLPKAGVHRISASVNGRNIAVPGRDGTARNVRWNLGQLGRLQPGPNRFRAQVLLNDGRVGLVSERFGVSQRRHLVVGRTQDDRPHVGRTIVLDSSRSLVLDRASAEVRWTLLRRPLLSKARLGASSGSGRRATTRLPLDVPGTYLIGVRIGSGSSAGYDVLAVTATYPNPLVPFDTITYPNGGTADALLLGSQSIAGSGQAITAYVVNRKSLGLTAVRGFSTGQYTDLSNYLSSLDDTSLVIVTVRASAAAAGLPDLPTLNGVLNKIGGTVPSSYGFVDGRCWSGTPEKCVNDGSHWQLSQWITNSFTVIGVPGMSVGNAWRATSGQNQTADGRLSGWLTLGVADGSDMADQYTVIPGGPDSYLSVDTCVGDDCSIQVGAKTYTPTPNVNGMHVLVLDRTTLKPIADRTVTSVSALLGALGSYFSPSIGSRWYTSPTITNDQALVIVQSVGTGQLTGSPTSVSSEVIDQLGGTAETFVKSIDGTQRYALVGAATNLPFHGLDGLESSTIMATAGENAAHASGRISGVIARDRQMTYTPKTGDPIGATNNDLYQILYQPAQAWPDADETDALSYIATRLGLTKYPDVRSAYTDLNYQYSWGGLLASLQNLTCTGQPFCGAEFDELQTRLEQEFTWVPLVYAFVENMRSPYVQAGSEPYFNIANVTNQVEKAVPPPSSASTGMGFLSIFTDSLFIGDVVVGSTAPEAEPFVGLLASSLSMVGDLIQAPDGSSTDTIKTTAGQLASQMAVQQTASEEGLDRLENILLTDYGRLSAVGKAIQTDPRWDWDNDDTINAITTLNTSALSSAYTALVPLTYAPFAMKPGSTETTTNDPKKYECDQGGDMAPKPGHPFAKATALSQLQVPSYPTSSATYEAWVMASMPAPWDYETITTNIAPDSLLTNIYGPSSTGPNGAYQYQPAWWHATYPIPHYTVCNVSGSYNSVWSQHYTPPKITRPPS